MEAAQVSQLADVIEWLDAKRGGCEGYVSTGFKQAWNVWSYTSLLLYVFIHITMQLLGLRPGWLSYTPKSMIYVVLSSVLLVVISFHCALNVLLNSTQTPHVGLEPRRTAHVVSTCAKRAYHPLARMQRIRDRVYKSKCILF